MLFLVPQTRRFRAGCAETRATSDRHSLPKGELNARHPITGYGSQEETKVFVSFCTSIELALAECECEQKPMQMRKQIIPEWTDLLAVFGSGIFPVYVGDHVCMSHIGVVRCDDIMVILTRQ